MAVISGLEVVDVGSCMWRIQAKEREIERERRRWFENLVVFCRFFLVTFSLCCCSPFKHCPWWRDEENVRYWQRCPGQCPNRLRLIERSIDRPNRYRDFRNQSRRLHRSRQQYRFRTRRMRSTTKPRKSSSRWSIQKGSFPVVYSSGWRRLGWMMTTVQIAGTAAPSSFAKSAALGSAAPCAAGGVCLALPTS